MEIKFGEWIVETSNKENEKFEYSNTSLRTLHTFGMQIRVKQYP